MSLIDDLLRSGRQITVLLETASSAGPVYASNTGYVTEHADATAPDRAYPDWLIGVPEIKQSLPDGLFGRSSIGWSDALLSNPGGVRDGWLYDAWDGRAVRLLVGAQDWALADFVVVFIGTVTAIQADRDGNLRLVLSDERERANRPVQPTISARPVSTGPALQPALPPQPGDPIDPPPGVEKPICMGDVFNIEPVLIDASTHTYRVHDSNIWAVFDVRVGGLSSAFTADVTAGTLRLDVFPAARVTCDARGQWFESSGSIFFPFRHVAGRFIREIAVRLGYTLFDDAGLAAFELAAPQRLGLYLNARDNGIDVLDAIAASVGAWWGIDALGRVTAAVAQIGVPVLTLTDDDIESFGLQLDQVTLPSWRRRVGWRRNYSVQSDGLFAAVDESARERLGREWDIAVAEHAGTKTDHPLATDPDIEPTLLIGGADARAEAARRLALFGVTGRAFRATATRRAWQVQIGQTVRVVHPRFGLQGGRDLIVTSVSRRLDSRITELGLWAPGQQSALTPTVLATEAGDILSAEDGAWLI